MKNPNIVGLIDGTKKQKPFDIKRAYLIKFCGKEYHSINKLGNSFADNTPVSCFESVDGERIWVDAKSNVHADSIGNERDELKKRYITFQKYGNFFFKNQVVKDNYGKEHKVWYQDGPQVFVQYDSNSWFHPSKLHLVSESSVKTDKFDEKRFKGFIKGLTKITQEYGIAISVVGGVQFAEKKNGFKTVTYTDDPTSGDIQPIFD